MKIRISLIILVIGFSLDLVGTWMKITHQAPADFVLTAGMLLKVGGLLLFIVFLMAHPKVKEFLEYDTYKDSFK